MENASHRRTRTWVIIGLVVYLLIVVAVLVLPVSYSAIVTAIGDWLRNELGIGGFGTGWIEFATNVLMFAPLGFLLTLLFQHSWRGVVLAFVFSACAELAQFVIPSRQPSLRDIVANVLGAALGAFLAWLIVLRRRKRRP
ncbi:VanZ family protein [Microbacterium murale]|uniref:VanZ-like domain-containing protein n=1 Tax=Microbacterium murale TaxID=1081040 RepID=A0ABQ1RN95_9MICO|nr:VanZ family protein [Microbacterium murale]GGD75595.1 hypothetical protein GCM10007269_18340 [Microbacterium murale]